MADKLAEVINAAMTRQQIKPENEEPTLTLISFRTGDASMISSVRDFVVAVQEEFDVTLEAVGGGYGCLKIIFRNTGEAYAIAELQELIRDEKFCRLALKYGLQVTILNDPDNPDNYERVDNRTGLSSKAMSSKAMKGQVPAEDQPVEFAILTALPDPEFRALRRELLKNTKSQEVRILDNDTTYFKYEINFNETKTYSVVASFQSKMGNVQAALMCERLIKRWVPKHVILMGIAGGLDRGKLSLGDVVVADEVLHYDVRRKEADERTRWAPTAYMVDRLLLNRVQDFHLDDGAINRWQGKNVLTLHPGASVPSLHIGTVACGDAIVDGERFTMELKNMNRRLLATEMEAGGFLEATVQQLSTVSSMVIRGISDFALAKTETDRDRNTDWRKYASETSASLAVEFLKYLSTIEQNPEVGMATMEQA
jgi:nucleoside phosphorylase